MAKKFILRAGVVPVTVCGETILITGSEARGKCPYTLHLSETSAYYLSLLEKGLSDAEMTEESAVYYGLDAEEAAEKISEFLGMLDEYGYLIPEDC